MSQRRHRPPPTKLHPPSTDATLLPREALVDALSALHDRKLAVVTAPSGAGKTTLLVQAYQRLRRDGWDTAWLSLDGFDDEPARFVAGLAAALALARPGLETALTGTTAIDAGLSLTDAIDALIAELAARPDRERPLAIFLDDCQALGNVDVVAAIGYLIQYTDATIRFVLASQRRLPLAIARLRVRGAVVELGFDDLRFNAAEVGDYLRSVRRIELPDERVAALADQTEGWISGLQLAAIALRQPGRPARPESSGPSLPPALATSPADPPTATEPGGFADALLDEILARESPETRAFLLDTALLDQFCAPLCDAVTGRSDSAERIEALERANLFIIRLDREQIWYRYHHLLQLYLRRRKAVQGHAALAEASLRAAHWFERNAMPADALRAALAAEDTVAAIRLLEGWGRVLLRDGNFKELHGQLRALGRRAVRGSAELAVLDAWTQLYLGDAIEAAAALDAADQAIARTPPARASLADEIVLVRSMCGVTRYDLVNTAWLRPDLADAFGVDEPLQRAWAQCVLGYGARVDGNQAAARRHFIEAIRIADTNDDTVVGLMARYNRAIGDQLCARPDQAIAGLRQWLDDPASRPRLRAGSTAFLHSALGLAATDRLEFAAAEAALDTAIDLLSVTHTFAYLGVARVLRARVLAATGRVAAALAEITLARELGAGRTMDRIRFRAAIAEARIRIADASADDRSVAAAAEAALAEAREILIASDQWQRELPTENWAHYELADCHRLARSGEFDLLLRRARTAAALEERAGRVRNRIEFGALAARATFAVPPADVSAPTFTGGASGHGDAASVLLAAVLRLAAPGGAWLPVVAAGRTLLEIPLAGQPDAGPLAAALRTAYERLDQAIMPPDAGGSEPSSAPAAPLHRREMQILTLVAQGLKNREIGERLHIGEETVKWYLKRAYEALGVRNRAHALARARELRLLG
ncbi:MAG: LuxR C-terminal-related transcriptional regulator [Lautropia sp.]